MEKKEILIDRIKGILTFGMVSNCSVLAYLYSSSPNQTKSLELDGTKVAESIWCRRLSGRLFVKLRPALLEKWKDKIYLASLAGVGLCFPLE